MNTILIDTNIVSYILKTDTRAKQYAPLLEGNRLALSFATVAELFEWSEIRRWGQNRRQHLEHHLTTYLIIPVDIEVCRLWGTIRAEQQAHGLAITANDAWIAATARRHGLPFVTHNPKDFAGVQGITIRSIIKPFDVNRDD